MAILGRYSPFLEPVGVEKPAWRWHSYLVCRAFLPGDIIGDALGSRLAVGHVTLDHVALVRIQAPQFQFDYGS
jgi:hypothetical protein